MKTKIKILIVSCLIATAAITGLDLAQDSNSMVVTLADIAVMAKADGEGGDCPGGSCTYTTYFAGEISGKCTACCPVGKDPECDEFGCDCN
ncbi:MAG: hypothetical protein WD607_06360 [Candidatus Paceibacterota bacterium]